jgi:hypothetical protein
MFRQGNEYNTIDTLKKLKTQAEFLSLFETIKMPVVIAAIDYYISLMENSSLIGLAFANFNEREQDLQYFKNQTKLNDSDFINRIMGYIASKPDSSEFKQLISNALEKSKLALEKQQKSSEKYQLKFNVICAASALLAAAATGNSDKDKLIMIVLFGCTMLFTYVGNKYLFPTNDYNNLQKIEQNIESVESIRPSI